MNEEQMMEDPEMMGPGMAEEPAAEDPEMMGPGAEEPSEEAPQGIIDGAKSSRKPSLEDVDEGLQAVKDDFVRDIGKVVTKESYVRQLLAKLEKSRNPAFDLGRSAVQAVHTLDKADDDNMPEEVIVQVCAETAMVMAEYASEGGYIQEDEKTAKTIIQGVGKGLADFYGMTEDDVAILRQSLEGMSA